MRISSHLCFYHYLCSLFLNEFYKIMLFLCGYVILVLLVLLSGSLEVMTFSFDHEPLYKGCKHFSS
jgi:hypothetical protein